MALIGKLNVVHISTPLVSIKKYIQCDDLLYCHLAGICHTTTKPQHRMPKQIGHWLQSVESGTYQYQQQPLPATIPNNSEQRDPQLNHTSSAKKLGIQLTYDQYLRLVSKPAEGGTLLTKPESRRRPKLGKHMATSNPRPILE